jgi:hypothetical protein
MTILDEVNKFTDFYIEELSLHLGTIAIGTRWLTPVRLAEILKISDKRAAMGRFVKILNYMRIWHTFSYVYHALGHVIINDYLFIKDQPWDYTWIKDLTESAFFIDMLGYSKREIEAMIHANSIVPYLVLSESITPSLIVEENSMPYVADASQFA